MRRVALLVITWASWAAVTAGQSVPPVRFPAVASIAMYDGHSLSLDGPEGPFRQLFTHLQTPAGAGNLSMGVEMLPPPPRDRDPRMIERNSGRVFQGQPNSLARTLEDLLGKTPDYDLGVSNGVIDIAPRKLRQSPSHFLNQRIGKFTVTDLPILEALVRLRQRVNPAFTVPRDKNGAVSLMFIIKKEEPDWFQRPISVSLEDPTGREALDALAAAATNVLWIATYESPVPWLPAMIVDETCTITLVQRANGKVSVIDLPPKRDPTRPSPLRPSDLPAIVRMAPPVTLDLPVTPARLASALQQISHNTHAQFGLETETAAASAQRDEGRAPKSYLLTGMSAAEALTKIVSFAPEYSWQLHGSIYHVRHKALGSTNTLPLDRSIAAIDRRFDGVTEALAGVSAALGAPAPATETPSLNFPELVNRRMFVSLPSGTIRDLLDTIVRVHGEMSWSVEYLRRPDTLHDVELTFSGFETWTRSIRITMR